MPYTSKEKQLEYMRKYHADGYDMLRRYNLSKEDYQKMWDKIYAELDKTNFDIDDIHNDEIEVI